MEETQSQKDNIGEIIEEFARSGDMTILRTLLVDLHPADIAEVIVRADRDLRQVILGLLDTSKAAEVLVELDSAVRHDVLQLLDEARVAEIIGTMESDDATDVIGELEDDVAQRILGALPREEFKEVKTLLGHDEETAGGIMALEIVVVDKDKTALEAQEVLRRKADEVDDVYNIYVVDNQGIFKGAVSLKDLVLADPQTRISQIMDDEAISIKLETDQEEVANIFHKYDLVAAPVVDQQGRLVGRITVDDVLDVVQEEASEDITMMAGITDESIRIPSIFKVSGVRLPWLLVAFMGELVSAGVMMHFEASVAQVFVAAIFIPLIMAMGGNMGIQSSTVVIRGLATGDIHLRDTGQRLMREVSVTFLNGFVIVFLLIGVVTLWSHLPISGKVLSTPAFGEVLGIPIFGMILGFALLAVMFNAAFMGTLLPFLFKRLGFDPAIATGPFITTTNDVLGLLVYFGIITGSLGWF